MVEQRFYKSTAAIGLYLLLFAGVLIAAFKVYYKRAIAREKRKHENYKKQKEAELFQQKLTFFSNIVHEIKTPLTVIHTPLQQIQASGHLSPADRDNLQAICNGTHYLDQLVRELLDFVRVEKRGYKLDCKPMNIVERTDSSARRSRRPPKHATCGSRSRRRGTTSASTRTNRP